MFVRIFVFLFFSHCISIFSQPHFSSSSYSSSGIFFYLLILSLFCRHFLFSVFFSLLSSHPYLFHTKTFLSLFIIFVCFIHTYIHTLICCFYFLWFSLISRSLILRIFSPRFSISLSFIHFLSPFFTLVFFILSVSLFFYSSFITLVFPAYKLFLFLSSFSFPSRFDLFLAIFSSRLLHFLLFYQFMFLLLFFLFFYLAATHSLFLSLHSHLFTPLIYSFVFSFLILLFFFFLFLFPLFLFLPVSFSSVAVLLPTHLAGLTSPTVPQNPRRATNKGLGQFFWCWEWIRLVTPEQWFVLQEIALCFRHTHTQLRSLWLTK